ncbi:MAG: deoxyribose-phosphate aldolase [Bifidobacteriaceae bacterium]|jgi:deoxyribose-phosphate aldolase|nr:deoxyribose-phosphate aldolase [Bifidobacteriaceae bacterium]
MNRTEMARMVDHTLLKPEATAADVQALVAEGRRLGVWSVCVSPSMIPLDADGLRVAVVCGFPSGAHHPEVKAAEAARALADGADELDMVINLRRVRDEDWAKVADDVQAVRAAFPRPGVLKVILETAALTDRQIVRSAEAAAEAGADFVKTSTGFHPAGGASVHAVELLAKAVGPAVGVKASGGIRTAEAALAMVDAGATRLGLSATAQVLAALAG